MREITLLCKKHNTFDKREVYYFTPGRYYTGSIDESCFSVIDDFGYTWTMGTGTDDSEGMYKIFYTMMEMREMKIKKLLNERSE